MSRKQLMLLLASFCWTACTTSLEFPPPVQGGGGAAQDACAPSSGGKAGAAGTSGAPGDASPCPDDSTFVCATPLEVGTAVKTTISPKGDADLYKFQTAGPGVLRLAVEPVPSNIDIDVYLYDDAQKQIAASLNTIAGQGVFLDYLAEAGTYYVKLVDGSNDATSNENYALLVSLDTSDPGEVNNTFGAATPITVSTAYQGKILPASDLDYLSFVTEKPGVLDLRVDPVPAELDIDLHLFDAEQKQILYSVNTAVGQAAFLSLLAPAATYYLLVEDGSHDASSSKVYSLLVDLDLSDSNEINNTFSDATAAALDTDQDGYIRPRDDLDIYAFDLSTAGTYLVTVGTVPTEVDIDVRVYNSTQQQIAYSVNAAVGQPVSQFPFSAAVAGKYYVAIEDGSHDAASKEKYTLRVKAGP